MAEENIPRLHLTDFIGYVRALLRPRMEHARYHAGSMAARRDLDYYKLHSPELQRSESAIVPSTFYGTTSVFLIQISMDQRPRKLS